MAKYTKPEKIAEAAITAAPLLGQLEKIFNSSPAALTEAKKILDFYSPYHENAAQAAELLQKILEVKGNGNLSQLPGMRRST